MYRRPHKFDPNYDDDPELDPDDDNDAIHAECLSSEERNPSLLNL